MLPADVSESAPQAACRACGQPLLDGQPICTACGAAHGEANRCPHCQAVADVQADGALGFRCLVCGGPRVALDLANVSLSATTRAALIEAGAQQTRHLMYGAIAAVLGVMGSLGVLLALLAVVAAAPGLLPTLAAFLGCAVPVGASAWAFGRARSARQLRGSALRRAQVSALGDAQLVTGTLDAARAAALMRLDVEHAELLLAEASVASLLREDTRARVPDEPHAQAGSNAKTDTEADALPDAATPAALGARSGGRGGLT
ncbi:MAG TPA: hypothetical protein VIW29_12190 [Polyangiaceae bacterium]